VSAAEAPVLILPGLYNSGPEHWQSRWESRHPGFRRIQQDDLLLQELRQVGVAR
jgi:hypothetical protein